MGTDSSPGHVSDAVSTSTVPGAQGALHTRLGGDVLFPVEETSGSGFTSSPAVWKLDAVQTTAPR